MLQQINLFIMYVYEYTAGRTSMLGRLRTDSKGKGSKDQEGEWETGDR